MALAITPLQARRLRRERARLWSAVPLSLLGHAAAFALFLAVSAWLAHPKPSRPKTHAVSIRSIGAHEWASNRNLSPVNSPGRSMPSRPAPILKGQVVDVAPGNNRESQTAKYLAETSNTVLKETRAREQTPVFSHATAKTTASPEAMPVAKGQVGGRSAPQVAGVRALDRLVSENGFRPRLSQLMKEATVGVEEAHLESPDRAGLEQGENEQVHSGDQAEASGGAPNDDLSNVAAGEGTFLNTREFKYASFFNRVKQAVSARWDPLGKLRSKDPRAAQLGSPDRVTVLSVTLRPDGTIREIFVSQSSGLDYLDQESIQAFEKAQPFSNPPTGLIENGVIRFAFGFKLMNDDRPGAPRMFRSGG